jgi:hypothetical protein
MKKAITTLLASLTIALALSLQTAHATSIPPFQCDECGKPRPNFLETVRQSDQNEDEFNRPYIRAW